MRPLVLLLFAVPVLAAPVPKSVKKAPPQFPDGVWLLQQFSSDGAAPAPPQSMVLDWVVAGEHIFAGAKVEPAHGAKGPPNFTIADPDRPHLRKWGVMPATYELDDGGNTLRCCYAHDGRKELTECKPEKGIHFYVFKRVK
jgi:hypothetical protein